MHKTMKATVFETPLTEANSWNGSLVEHHIYTAKKRAANDIQHHLELSLGIPPNSSSNDTVMSSTSDGKPSLPDNTTPDVLIFGQRTFNLAPTAAATSFMPAAAVDPGAGGCFINPHGVPSGFIDPWSLAARQQKAAYEKAYQKLNSPPPPRPPPLRSPSMPRITHTTVLPAVVGWPPIRRFRKNLLFKSTMAHENGANFVMAGNQGANIPAPGNPMFVKVNMQGIPVCRKINLALHNDYDSFFHTMQKLFRNFLDAYLDDTDDEDVDDDIYDEFLVLYDDHEGDRILVGDIPWGDFVASVRRLYIVPNPRATRNGFPGAGI